MSSLQSLRAAVNERLTAAAEEIFALFERTIVEYEEKVWSSEKENQRKQRLLDEALRPGDLLHRARAPSPAGPGLRHEDTVQIKEEQQQQQQETETEEQVTSRFVLDSSSICVKTEESSLLQQKQSDHKEETQEQDVSSEPHFRPETEEDSEHSSDVDRDEDWKCSLRPADSQMETEANHIYSQFQIRDRAAQNSHQSPVNKFVINNEDIAGTDKGREGKKHQCSVCKKRFYYNSSLKGHMRVHTGERPYGCSMCEKRFKLKGHLKIHFATHTGEKHYSCLCCSKSFFRRCALRRHMSIHTGERPYGCSMCEKKFKRKSHLKLHIGTHSGEKPYSCLICSKTFLRTCALRRHMKIHTGEKPYS